MASQVEEVVKGPNLTGALGEENLLKESRDELLGVAVGSDVISRADTGVHLDVAALRTQCRRRRESVSVDFPV